MKCLILQGCRLERPANLSIKKAACSSPTLQPPHIMRSDTPEQLKSSFNGWFLCILSTLACLSSSSASSTRFFLKAATRLVLKSMSSVWRRMHCESRLHTHPTLLHLYADIGRTKNDLAWQTLRFSQTCGSKAADWSQPAEHLCFWPEPYLEPC